MWRDEHTGLYHTHYRIYNPQFARWLTPDPAGYMNGMNLYRFYGGPNGVDPMGDFVFVPVLAYLGWVALNTAIDVALDSVVETTLGDGKMSGSDLAWSAGVNGTVNFFTAGVGGKLTKARHLKQLGKLGITSKNAIRATETIGTIATDAALTSLAQGTAGIMRGEDANFTQNFGYGLVGGTLGRAIGQGIKWGVKGFKQRGAGDDFITFYHGTSKEGADSIRKIGIDIDTFAKPKKDFGKGFYTTTDYDQALKWASRKKGGGEVLTFRVMKSDLNKLHSVELRNGSFATKLFVGHNRLGGRMHGFDTVSGPMLGNPLFDSTTKWYKGFAPNWFGQQTTFHTTEAIEILYRGLIP